MVGLSWVERRCKTVLRFRSDFVFQVSILKLTRLSSKSCIVLLRELSSAGKHGLAPVGLIAIDPCRSSPAGGAVLFSVVIVVCEMSVAVQSWSRPGVYASESSVVSATVVVDELMLGRLTFCQSLGAGGRLTGVDSSGGRTSWVAETGSVLRHEPGGPHVASCFCLGVCTICVVECGALGLVRMRC